MRSNYSVATLVITLLVLAAVVGLLIAAGWDGKATQFPAETLRTVPRFEHEGNSYAVIRGDLYLLQGDGEAEFVDDFYDPEFRERNYERREGQLLQKDPDSGETYAVSRSFSDGFEGIASVDELLAVSRWHQYNTNPARAGQAHNYYDLGNRITLSRDIVHSGEAALRFEAQPNSDDVSKASITKNIFYFEKGDDVWFSGWFFVEDTPSLVDAGAFTLVDFESTFFRYVGLRVIFRRHDSLAFELKLPKRQFEQERGSEQPFPTGRGVHVKTHFFLSDMPAEGRVRIWQDGRLVLDRNGRTLPVAATVYDSLELGITVMAKGSRYKKVLYVDDVAISDAPIAD